MDALTLVHDSCAVTVFFDIHNDIRVDRWIVDRAACDRLQALVRWMARRPRCSAVHLELARNHDSLGKHHAPLNRR